MALKNVHAGVHPVKDFKVFLLLYLQLSAPNFVILIFCLQNVAVLSMGFLCLHHIPSTLNHLTEIRIPILYSMTASATTHQHCLTNFETVSPIHNLKPAHLTSQTKTATYPHLSRHKQVLCTPHTVYHTLPVTSHSQHVPTTTACLMKYGRITLCQNNHLRKRVVYYTAWPIHMTSNCIRN
jgi:hypothetical protein